MGEAGRLPNLDAYAALRKVAHAVGVRVPLVLLAAEPTFRPPEWLCTRLSFFCDHTAPMVSNLVLFATQLVSSSSQGLQSE